MKNVLIREATFWPNSFDTGFSVSVEVTIGDSFYVRKADEPLFPRLDIGQEGVLSIVLVYCPASIRSFLKDLDRPEVFTLLAEEISRADDNPNPFFGPVITRLDEGLSFKWSWNKSLVSAYDFMLSRYTHIQHLMEEWGRMLTRLKALGISPDRFLADGTPFLNLTS